MKHQDSSEMYLKTILILEVNKGEVHAKEIADVLEVSKASVTKAISSLKRKDFITQDNYGPVFLTEAGRQVARHIIYKNRLLSRYLEIDLNLCAKDAKENACRMEHIVTNEMLEAIEKKLNINIENEMRLALEDIKS